MYQNPLRSESAQGGRAINIPTVSTKCEIQIKANTLIKSIRLLISLQIKNFDEPIFEE